MLLSAALCRRSIRQIPVRKVKTIGADAEAFSRSAKVLRSRLHGKRLRARALARRHPRGRCPGSVLFAVHGVRPASFMVLFGGCFRAECAFGKGLVFIISRSPAGITSTRFRGPQKSGCVHLQSLPVHSEVVPGGRLRPLCDHQHRFQIWCLDLCVEAHR